MKVIDQAAKVLVSESPMKHIEKIGRICYKSEDKIEEDTDKKFVNMLYKHQHHAMLEHYRFIMQVNPLIYKSLELVEHPHVQMTYCEFNGYDRFVISLNARALINLVRDSRAEHHGILPIVVESIKNELIGHILYRYDCYELFGMDRSIPSLLSTGIDFIENSPFAMSEKEWKIHGWASVHMVTDRGISHEIVRHREETSFAQESTRYCNYDKDKFGSEITVIDHGFQGEARDIWEDVMKHSESVYSNLINIGHKPEMARSVLPTCLKTEIVMTAPMYEWDHFFNLRMLGTTGTPHPLIKKLSILAHTSMQEVFYGINKN